MNRLNDADHPKVFQREQVLAVAGYEVARPTGMGGFENQVVRVLTGDDLDRSSGLIEVNDLQHSVHQPSGVGAPKLNFEQKGACRKTPTPTCA
jgi:hypothetical protein